MHITHCLNASTGGIIFLTRFFGLSFAINPVSHCFNQKSLIVRIFFFLIVLHFLCLPSFAQTQLSQSREERLFQKGTELIAHSNYGAARKVFSEFLEEAAPSDPRRGEAEYYV